jgi:hypothetical protein
MGDVFDQVSQQPATTAPAAQPQGDIFDQVAAGAHTQQQQQTPAAQPGFLSRAYETSPLPGIFDAAKQSIADFVKGPDQAAQAFNEMIGSLSQGNFSDAAHHAAKLLTGSESPFQEAARSVIKEYTQNALANLKKVQQGDVSEIPAGNAVKNYVADVRAGNTSGAIGDVVGGVSSVLPMLLGDEASVGKVKGAIADTAESVAGKVKPLVSEEAAGVTGQPEVQSAVRDVAKATEPTAIETPSVRSAVESAGDQVYSRSKSAYAQLDDATGGRYQRFTDQIRNLQNKMNEVAGIDDDAYESYELKRNEIETTQNNLIEQLVQDEKIDPKLAEQAKTDFKQSMALYDLDSAVKASTKGVRPEQATAGSTAEMLDPQKLDVRLQKLNDSGRLAQAVGEDGATQLIQRVDGALRSRTAAISRAKFIKATLKYVGIGSAALATGGGLAHVLAGGSK